MDLYEYMENNVKIEEIKDFKGDKYELSIARYVLKETSKIFYRDITFFLNKEEINQREKIYNKKLDIKNIDDFSIVCKSYCNIIKDILKDKYQIETELISSYDDSLKHIDLLLTTKKQNRYIIDPLMDLEKMQIGMKTEFFASKEKYEKFYVGKLKNINYMNEKELQEIDDRIHYTIQGLYMDDVFELIKKDFLNVEKILKENENLSFELLGKKYEGEKLSQDRKLELKFDFISKYLNNRRYINGIVDFTMYTNNMLSKLFTEEEMKKIKPYKFFVDDKDIKDNKLKSMFIDEENRKRGMIFELKDKCYIITLKPDMNLKLPKKECDTLIKRNNIYVRPIYPVILLEYLKKIGADRNIVHHNEFLRSFNKFEQEMLNDGFNINEIKEYVKVTDKAIKTNYNQTLEYEIEEGNLAICDKKNKTKTVILYKDEGRNIEYIKQKQEECMER